MAADDYSKNKNNSQKIDKNTDNKFGLNQEKSNKDKFIFDEINIKLYDNGKYLEKEDLVIKESPLTIFINKYELLTLMVLQENLEELVIGFLVSEGIIEKTKEIIKLEFKQNNTAALVEISSDFKVGAFKKRTLTSACGSGSTFLNLNKFRENKLSADIDQLEAVKIFELIKKMQENSKYFKRTGGTHISALAEAGNILFSIEDIGRHNTFDKIIGKALKEEISLENKIILTSGRISSEMIIKVLRQGIPFLISRSAPTDKAVNIAVEHNLTLVGFCRGRRMNIYSASERIK